jgi:hypothetical protein
MLSIAFRRLLLCWWLLRDVVGFSTTTSKYLSSLSALPGADIEQETDEKQSPQVVGDKIIYRGKVNEIDYCIAPGDVSLSRASGQIITKSGDKKTPETISLTQAINNASNRAVRRILLAKSWPSEEAFNLSLRLAASAEKEAEEVREADTNPSTAICPVPRPILNLLTRKDTSSSAITSPSAKSGVSGMASSANSFTKTRTNKEYVEDQIIAFQERYGSLPGYSGAEAFLESILSLATTGDESPRVKEVSKCIHIHHQHHYHFLVDTFSRIFPL